MPVPITTDNSCIVSCCMPNLLHAKVCILQHYSAIFQCDFSLIPSFSHFDCSFYFIANSLRIQKGVRGSMRYVPASGRQCWQSYHTSYFNKGSAAFYTAGVQGNRACLLYVLTICVRWCVCSCVNADVPFDKTVNSVPEPNPSRDWESLDVQNEPNPNY